jgi:2-oxoisovalerate dehydrogenase E1 component
MLKVSLDEAYVFDLLSIYQVKINNSLDEKKVKLVESHKQLSLEIINQIGEVLFYEIIKSARDYCIQNQKPFLLECMTFRMRGHEEASGTKYVPKELFDVWGRKDPVNTFEKFLLDEGVLTEDIIEKLRSDIKKDIDEILK